MSRTILALVCSLIIGVVMVRRHPFPLQSDIMVVLAASKPWLVQILDLGWRVMLFTTPFIFLSTIFSFVFIYAGGSKKGVSILPPYPKLQDTDPLMVVIGEVHHQRKFVQVENPTWLTIPERGLYTGMAVFGAIGSGKTSTCMYSFANQIFSWRSRSKAQRAGGIILEVKGDFCYRVKEILQAAGREEDYAEISLTTQYVYNPIHNAMDEFSVAYAIASLINNLHGRGKEPFWQQAYVNLVKFVVLAHRVVDSYCTFIDVYLSVINPEALAAKIKAGQQHLAELLESTTEWITISLDDYVAHPELKAEGWESHGDMVRIPASDDVMAELYARRIMYSTTGGPTRDPADIEDRIKKLEAVKRWFEWDWMRIDQKLRTSIVEGISVFLSVFDSDPRLKRIFCPPKECYDPVLNADHRYGKPLPSWDELIEQGTVLALNFPAGENVATARTIGVMLKLDFERAMLARIPRMERSPEKVYRPVLFLCDEYQLFATVGEQDPTGDEKFFSLSRQAKCIPLVATQSISSLRSALSGESWRTLLQTFRTKIFLTLSDDFSATIASELCGKDEQTVISHSTSESGQDARVGLMTGKLQSHKSSVTINTSFQPQIRPIFQPLTFAHLKNAQSIVLAYDGVNPHPATICYLKPYYLDQNLSYWQQLESGTI